MKSAVIIAVFAGLANFVVAAPPACLLAALGQQRSPASVDDLCNDSMYAMLGNITSVCQGEDLKAAYNAYASTCSEVGVKVDDFPSVAGTPEPSGNSNPEATSTPSSTTSNGDNPQESKPSAAGAIAPHAFLFTVLGLSATGLVSVVFL